MKKSEIRKYALERILEGKSRQETYLELKEDGIAKPEEIADVVRYVPSLENRKKFKIPYVALLALMGIGLALRMLGVFGLWIEGQTPVAIGYAITAIIPIYFLYALGTYRTKVLNIIAILGGLGLLRAIIALAQNTAIYEMIDVILVGIITVLAYYLNKNIANPYEIVKEPYLDQQGNKKVKRLIVFQD